MAYKVTLSPEAAKEFRKLDSTIQKRIAALVTKIETSINPRFSGKHSKVTTKNGAIASATTAWYAKSKTAN